MDKGEGISTIRRLFLSFFGSGFAPKAPGTVGTLASMPVGALVLFYLGAQSLFMLTFAVTVIGIVEVNRYESITRRHDPSWIVIDESAGIWLTMVITSYAQSYIESAYLYPAVLLASFLSFRLFDITKPSTIGWIDRNLEGGLGVMLDDILAALAAGALNLLLFKSLAALLS